MKRKIGVIFSLEEILSKGIGRLEELSIDCIQMVHWHPDLLTEENANRVKEIIKGKVEISSIWAGWSGPQVWDLVSGPSTLGIVPVEYRYQRMQELMKAADFAIMLGVHEIETHIGFVPEDHQSHEYHSFLCATKYVADYCKSKGVRFNFETGQETPVNLMRLILDLENDYVGINLDPANLIIYGSANPIDSLGIFADRIRGVHIKDADYTTDPRKMGTERVVGEGSVNFPVFLEKLINQYGYKGDLFIEREIEGDQQTEDIKNTVKFVQNILSTIE